MKRPSLRFDLGAIKGFLFRHCEKLVFAAIAAAALGLAWGGFSGWRSQSVTEDRLPEAITAKAADADAHIGEIRETPAERIPGHEPLPSRLDAWRNPLPPWLATSSLEVAEPAELSLLDKPLFEELAKRTKPDVFPVEDLRATAGIAVLSAAARPDAAVPPPEGQPVVGPQARLVPYVIVTGLIPAEKQQQEYRGRFETVGFRDAKRDSPLWTDFVVERAVGTGGTDAGKWESVDLVAAAAWLKREQAAAVPDRPPARYLLGDTEQFRRAALDFCCPLPQPIEGGWDLGEVHPWVLARMQEDAAAPGGGALPESQPGGQPFNEAAPQPQAGPQPNLAPPARMFRFIDTAVQPGRTYRYRVRIRVVNPNVGLKPPAVEDAALGKEVQLASPPSQASAPVTVPDSTRLLVRSLTREDAKKMKLKPGTSEVLVLAPSKVSGGYSLRAVYVEAGATANVEEKVDKAGESRARGEPFDTGRMIVDVRGRQEDRRDSLAAKSREPIPEPVELLSLRSDGRFERVSAADVERLVGRYLATLPPLEAGRRDDRKGQPADPAADVAPIPFSPFADPPPAAQP